MSGSEEPDLEELREASSFGDRDDPDAKSPFADADNDEEDGTDDIHEDLVDRIDHIVNGDGNRSLGCRDPMFTAYLDHLSEHPDRMDAIVEDLADQLGVNPPTDPGKADVVRLLLRIGLTEGAPEEAERVMEARADHQRRTI